MAAYQADTNLQQLMQSGAPTAFYQSGSGSKKIEKALETDARNLLLKQSATELGSREGFKSQMNTIRREIKSQERNLDSIYNFAPLMITPKLVPPIIVEQHDVINQNSYKQIVIADTVYSVFSQAKLSTTPPSWRGYLYLPIGESEMTTLMPMSVISDELKPKNDREYKLWKQSLISGWIQGTKQANNRLSYGFGKLNRDYIGMMRYHQFRLEGKISAPQLVETSQAVSSNGNTVVVNQTFFEIKTLPTLNARVDTWKSYITEKVAESFMNKSEQTAFTNPTAVIKQVTGKDADEMALHTAVKLVDQRPVKPIAVFAESKESLPGSSQTIGIVPPALK